VPAANAAATAARAIATIVGCVAVKMGAGFEARDSGAGCGCGDFTGKGTAAPPLPRAAPVTAVLDAGLEDGGRGAALPNAAALRLSLAVSSADSRSGAGATRLTSPSSSDDDDDGDDEDEDKEVGESMAPAFSSPLPPPPPLTVCHESEEE
jgi:hypothetical protein